MPGQWEAIGLAVEIAGGGAAVAWWVVRSFWKIDVRLESIETQLGMRERGREAQREQRSRSAFRILSRGNGGAHGKDHH